MVFAPIAVGLMRLFVPLAAAVMVVASGSIFALIVPPNGPEAKRKN